MTPTITMLTDNKRGAFELHLNDQIVAKMTFVYAGRTKFIIDHTEVNHEYNGNGYGKLLIQKAIAFAKEKDLKIMPLCPFAKAYFDKHPELSDVISS